VLISISLLSSPTVSAAAHPEAYVAYTKGSSAAEERVEAQSMPRGAEAKEEVPTLAVRCSSLDARNVASRGDEGGESYSRG
jgi:hypothetical protein